MRTLRELEAFFIRHVDERTHRHVETKEEAHGVQFLCPVCFERNGGARGTHQVLCWSRTAGAPDSAVPGPGRWTMHGTSIDDLTLHGDPVGGARSIQLNGGCNAHFFITNGAATEQG